MGFSSSGIKGRAKEIIKTAKPSVIVAGMIYLALELVTTYLSQSVLTGKISEHDAEQFLEAYTKKDFDYLMSFTARFQPTPSAWLINVAISVVMLIVSAGFIIFIINTVRCTGAASYGNLLDGFGNAFKIVLLSFLEGLFIVLWSLLLIVPGFIAAYKYRQAIYILLDNPEKSVMQCIKESKQMMAGHKWELFGFDLSFLGWFLLGGIIPVVNIWVYPYTKTSYMLYYEYVRPLNRAETV